MRGLTMRRVHWTPGWILPCFSLSRMMEHRGERLEFWGFGFGEWGLYFVRRVRPAANATDQEGGGDE